jgi:hypothetical protein
MAKQRSKTKEQAEQVNKIVQCLSKSIRDTGDVTSENVFTAMVITLYSFSAMYLKLSDADFMRYFQEEIKDININFMSIH